MKNRILILTIALCLITVLSACDVTPEETNPTDDKNSVFYPTDTKDFVGTVESYEDTADGTMLSVREERSGDIYSVLIWEGTHFGKGAEDDYAKREVGWKISVVSHYNRLEYEDFYPCSYIWVVEESQES